MALKRRVCSVCGKEKTIRHGFYSKNRYHCILCERASSRKRMLSPENRAKRAHRQAKAGAIKFGAIDTLTVDDVMYLFKLADGRCAYTGEPSDNLSLEHVIPLAKKGRNSIENVIVIDLSLNRKKSDGSMINFIDSKLNPHDSAPIVKLLAARGNMPYETLYSQLEQFQHEECNAEYKRWQAAYEKRKSKKQPPA